MMDWTRIALAALSVFLIFCAYDSFKNWKARANTWDLVFAVCSAVGGVGLATATAFGW